MGSRGLTIIFWVIILGVILFVFRTGIFSHIIFPNSPYDPFSSSTSTPHPFFWQTQPQPVPSIPVTQYPNVNPSQNNQSSSQEIPLGFTASQLSPYFHKMRIGAVSPGSAFYYGQISLYTNLAAGDRVDVTGWRFVANRGSQIIPKAVNMYDPSGLAAEGDIRLSSGDVLNIYSLQSAIGENVRLNKCIGYLEIDNHFTPQLPLTCPYIDRSEISNLTGACQNVILSIGSCRLPPDNPSIAPTDYPCKDFLSRINYKGCFDTHSSDADFLSHEWRAWTGYRFLDPDHDKLLLYDKKGLLVDIHEY